MPQTLLPIFPAEATAINHVVSFAKRDGTVYYFHGCQPVFSHDEHDLKSFRMFTSQLAVNGSCKQVEIVRAFGISAISMKRYVKKYREGGAAAFYGQRRKPQPRVLTAEVMRQAQELFEQGETRSAVAQRLGLKTDTLSKAVRAGRLVEPVKKRIGEHEKPAQCSRRAGRDGDGLHPGRGTSERGGGDVSRGADAL